MTLLPFPLTTSADGTTALVDERVPVRIPGGARRVLEEDPR